MKSFFFMLVILELFVFKYLIKGDCFLPMLSYKFFEFIRNNGLPTSAETHLKNIGLLSNSNIFIIPDEDKESVTINYFSEEYIVTNDNNDGDLEVYHLTDVGKELAPISGAEPNTDYTKCLINHGDLKLKT